MIELIETGMPGKIMVYVTIDERKIVEQLFRIKEESAIYYNMKDHGKKIAYHWLLNPITVKRLFPGIRVKE